MNEEEEEMGKENDVSGRKIVKHITYLIPLTIVVLTE